MEGDPLGWNNYGGYDGNDNNSWDLSAVVCLGGGGPGAPAPPYYNNPMFALPPPPQQQNALPAADNAWQQLTALPAPGDPDDDFLSQILLAGDQVPAGEAQLPPALQPTNGPPLHPEPANKPSGGAGSSRSRGRRNMENIRTVTVPAAGLSTADAWSWRKYGQKVIKGKPYQRSYYRCSSDKDCDARRRVERSATDPSLLVVTYAGEHCHGMPRAGNTLAGTMRDEEAEGQPSRRRRGRPKAGGPSQAAPPPMPAPAVASMTAPSEELDAEEDDALDMLIDNPNFAPEGVLLVPNPHGGPAK